MASTDRCDYMETGNPREVKFLHGYLDLWIYEAKSLPNMDLIVGNVAKCFSIFGPCASPCQKGRKKTMRHNIITSDPYVSVCLAGATVAQTQVIPNSENPRWNEHFFVPVAHPVTAVEFLVKDNDICGAELIGTASIPVDKVLSGSMIEDWFHVVGRYEEPFPKLYLRLKFESIDAPLCRVDRGSTFSGVHSTYFPLHKEGSVTLYQDAHVSGDDVHKIHLDGKNKLFEQGRCWEDIFHAIQDAQHFIYITGWSVFHPVKLIRVPGKAAEDGGHPSLGELLKQKSQHVRVLMLVWDDKTSHDKLLFKMDGVMGTHDEETRKFFKHSHVHCVLAPRYASNKLSIFKQKVVGTMFSHHQKCVIVDTKAAGDKRTIAAFIGGLDLCDGRYDTPEHRLFPDFDSVFKNDFYNPTYPRQTQGPRQPWHDLHCRIEGPAAYDVLTNFEQRWRKATKWHDLNVSRVARWHDDALVKLDQIPGLLASESPSNREYTEQWHVQIFRSIDSGSVKGFPKTLQEAVAKNLICAKNLKIDKSIHTAYVEAIRSAKHFVYIENQYFIGSSYGWISYEKAGADNLVPMELALKIASKIKAKERFSVYIVIPMWPEGVPSNPVVQEMLFWQGQTMKMMYRIVANALEEAQSGSHPQDYLNFYCLGKHEPAPVGESSNDQPGESPSCTSQKYRRFMIYVHAKGMIIDDEYVVIGSANINQRSLDGSRDTEIAMGAYQPLSSDSGEMRQSRGQVFGYRMSLWSEHLGAPEDVFRKPEAVECVRRVNRLAEGNWRAYAGGEEGEEIMTGHLMKYPVRVESNGGVGPLPGNECFPDVGGKVLGAHSTTIPDILTT